MGVVVPFIRQELDRLWRAYIDAFAAWECEPTAENSIAKQAAFKAFADAYAGRAA